MLVRMWKKNLLPMYSFLRSYWGCVLPNQKSKLQKMPLETSWRISNIRERRCKSSTWWWREGPRMIAVPSREEKIQTKVGKGVGGRTQDTVMLRNCTFNSPLQLYPLFGLRPECPCKPGPDSHLYWACLCHELIKFVLLLALLPRSSEINGEEIRSRKHRAASCPRSCFARCPVPISDSSPARHPTMRVLDFPRLVHKPNPVTSPEEAPVKSRGGCSHTMASLLSSSPGSSLS